jgi:large subunit ribosomal protein L14
MIFKESILKVVDNSGALYAKCIGIKGNTIASIGSIITVSIIKALSNRKIKKGEVHKAIIIRTKKGVIRPDGSFLQFDENSLILLEADSTPKGTRILGPLPFELTSYSKIASLATKFI